MRVHAAVVILVLTASPALADSTNGGWSGHAAPNDPGYAAGESDPLAACVNEEEWFLYGHIPRCTPLARDPAGTAGLNIDEAWKQFTIGRPDVVIAYMEGGVNWHLAPYPAELAARTYINRGELPVPERHDGSACPAYDCNGDGTFNVYDYAGDPRIKRPYVNGALTPEDLIVAFGDCRIDPGTDRIDSCTPGRHYDNDRDGYPNDISGWNFMYGNNDPQTSDGAYNHADEQLSRAAAEANNGIGDAGVCPGCMLLPIKAGHEALDRTDRVAQSIYFAVASHASVVDLLAGEIGYSRATRTALDYAWRKGVVTVGASNDFDSGDHQEGTFWPRMWPGNGLVADGAGTIPQLVKTDRLTTTFRSRSNYTSFGPHALFSMPNEGGSTSESTPTQAGVAGLIASAGRNAADAHQIARPLDAGEIEQVLRETATNIDDPNLGWPGKPGATFNIQYGYGRPDVVKAMQAVAADRIPPAPDILSPDWYTLYDPSRDTSVPIKVDINARRAARFSWRVQYGLGADPTEAQFVTLATGSSNRHDLHAVLARLSLQDIPRAFWSKPYAFTPDLNSTEQYDVTIRVQATDERGNMGEDRRSVQVFHDPSIRRGFPVKLTYGAPFGSPALADLTGRGRLDIVFGDSNGYIHAFDPDSGRELPGWPAHLKPLDFSLARASGAGRAAAAPRAAYEPVVSPVAIGDLAGDGAQDVVVTSTSGRVYAFDRHGHLLHGFPRTLGTQAATLPVPPPRADYTRSPALGSVAPPVLTRLPGAGRGLDILQAAWDGNLYAFDARGHTVPGWPIDAQLPVADRPQPPYIDLHDHKLVATPTMADLFGDGRREIVIKSQEFAYDTNSIVGDLGLGSTFYELAYWPDGNRHPGGALVHGFPVLLDGLFGYYSSGQDWLTEGGDSAAAAPLPGTTGDTVGQNLVLAVPQFLTAAGTAPQSQQQPDVVTLIATRAATAQPGVNHDRVATSTTAEVPITFTTSGTMAPFAGRMAYLTAGTDLVSLAAIIHPGIAQRITNFMLAYDAATGKMLPGFAAPEIGLAFLTAPAVADIGGTGQADVIGNADSSGVAAFGPDGRPVPGWPKFTGGWTAWTPAIGDLDGNGHVEVVDVTREGYLFVWSTPGEASHIEAWAWHQNDWHTGRYGDDTRPPLVPRRATYRGGRLCFVAPGGDWGDGSAARYELRAFTATRPSPETFAYGLRVPGVRLPRPVAGGAGACISVPHSALPRRARWLGVRAVDQTGLIGYPAAVRAEHPPGPGAT
jgi:hypothetical protein